MGTFLGNDTSWECLDLTPHPPIPTSLTAFYTAFRCVIDYGERQGLDVRGWKIHVGRETWEAYRQALEAEARLSFILPPPAFFLHFRGWHVRMTPTMAEGIAELRPPSEEWHASVPLLLRVEPIDEHAEYEVRALQGWDEAVDLEEAALLRERLRTLAPIDVDDDNPF